MEDKIDEFVAELQSKLNKEINSMYLPILKTLEDVRSMPRTVCLVYMTEQHDGGQASYCEVYKDEDTARTVLEKAGFRQNGPLDCLTREDEFSPYPDTATIVPEVRVKTDADSL